MPDKSIKKKIYKLQSQYVKGVWDGDIDPLHLSDDYYDLITTYFVDAISEGFGATLETLEFGTPDYELFEELQNNIYMFSAAKTFQQTLEMSEALVDDKGELRSFDDFQDIAKEIYARYNGGEFTDEDGESKELNGYLDTEYNTAIIQSYNANRWQKIEDQKETLPYLTFVAVGDELVCDICGELDGLTAPVDDGVWDTCSPAQHWNCRCIIEQHDEDEGKEKAWDEDEINDAVEKANVPDYFKFNPGKAKEVFSTEGVSKHGYFSVPKEYISFAEHNFGLEMPEAATMTERIDALMNRAKQSAPELERNATKIAEKRGAVVSNTNLKSFDSIERKVKDDYGGHVESVKDAVRNTIVEDEKRIPSILKDFKNEIPDATIKRQFAATDALGYNGNIVNYKTKNGLTVETQVNTAKMIYAKDKFAKSILGDDVYKAIEKETGMKSGLGHTYYEEYRKITDEAIVKDPSLIERAKEIESLSKEYYSHFY